MRSILTALGIIIGVAAVIAMVGIGSGARAQVESQISSLGENLILISPGSVTSSGLRTGWGGSATLKGEDATAIQNEVSGITATSPEIRQNSQVTAASGNWFTQILGESADFFDMRKWQFSEGTGFTEQDVRSANKVAVIGKTLSTQLYGTASPIGEILRVKNVKFIVTGVLAHKGFNVNGTDQDDVAVVPYTSAMKRLTGSRNLRGITVQVGNANLIIPAQEEITLLLRQRHRITSDTEDDFTVRNQEEIAEAATATSRVMSTLLGSIASVSLLVGGIGIMNIMLVSVTERTREIGIRMSVGAHGSDILAQFLIEAVALSSMGGIIGICLGVGTAKLLSVVAHWPTLVSPLSILIAFAFSAAVGVFFGFYPARKAAALDPIDALRYE